LVDGGLGVVGLVGGGVESVGVGGLVGGGVNSSSVRSIGVNSVPPSLEGAPTNRLDSTDLATHKSKEAKQEYKTTPEASEQPKSWWQQILDFFSYIFSSH
jgi:hypothetical protein